MKSEIKDASSGVLIWIVMLILWAPIWGLVSHFEAKTYNKITGNNVSTWDAMWVQLRVTDAPAPLRDSKQ